MAAPDTLEHYPGPMQKRLLPVTLAAFLAVLATGCSQLHFPGVYRIDIEQGNVVDEKMLGALKPGMTPAQVRYVMGPPQMIDPFDASRWVYRYRLLRGNGKVVDNKVELRFENGALARWEGQALPPGTRYHSPTADAATTPDNDGDAPATAPAAGKD